MSHSGPPIAADSLRSRQHVDHVVKIHAAGILRTPPRRYPPSPVLVLLKLSFHTSATMYASGGQWALRLRHVAGCLNIVQPEQRGAGFTAHQWLLTPRHGRLRVRPVLSTIKISAAKSGSEEESIAAGACMNGRR